VRLFFWLQGIRHSYVGLETFRTRTFKLLSKAYTSLPLALGQVYLGLTAEQLLAGMPLVKKYYLPIDSDCNVH
jgi:hypothetical protein